MTPALAEGASRDPEALSHIIRVAGGYPYFLQEYGSVAWNVALGPVITPHDAVVAEQFGQTKLDARVLRQPLGPGHSGRTRLPPCDGGRRRWTQPVQ